MSRKGPETCRFLNTRAWMCKMCVHRPHPGEVGADVQLRQRLADIAAQLGGGGIRLLIVAAWVVERALDAGPDQAQVEIKLPCSLLKHLQTNAGVLQSLLGLPHG